MNKAQTLHCRKWAVLVLVGIAILAIAPDLSSARSGQRSDDVPVRLSLALGHSRPISVFPTLAWSPDGRTLATGSPDHTVVLWDAATRKPRATLAGHRGWVDALVWSPDGKRIASSDSFTTCLWDAATGRLRLRLAGSLLTQQGVQVYWPDTRHVATREKPGVVVWDAATGRRRATLPCAGSYFIGNLSWSPDGKQLAIDNLTSLTLWDLRSGTRRGTLAKPDRQFVDLAWSLDGTRIAGLGLGGDEVFLWDAATGARRTTLSVPLRENFDTSVTRVAWAPDGKSLATGSSNGEVNLWDGATGERRSTLPGDNDDVRALSWSPDGKTLAVQNGSATTLWDVAARARRATLPNTQTPLVWRSDGKVLATSAGPGDELVLIWDGRTGRRVASLPFLLSCVSDGSVNWSPDGKTIAVGTGDRGWGMTFLWETATGKLRSTLRGHHAKVSGLAWSPDGKSLATASGEFGPDEKFGGHMAWNRGSAFLWDAATGQRRATLPDAAGPAAWSPDGRTLATGPGVRLWLPDAAAPWIGLYPAQTAVALAWSPDSKMLAAVKRWVRGLGTDLATGNQETLTVWEVATREWRFSRDVPYVGVFAWSPDGRTIALGGAEGGVVLLDAATGDVRDRLPNTKPLPGVAAWSPDGRLLATGYWNGSVILWNASTGRRTAVLAPRKGSVGGPTVPVWGEHAIPRLAWNPDGKTLAVTQVDRTVRLWDTATARCRATLVGHTGEIRALAWSPDGKTLATGSSDGSLRLWRAATGQPRAALYAIDQGREWVTVTPGGYFVASKNGTGYVQGRQGTRLLPAPELLKRCMRADAVRKALAD
jgi:WD40 repeat protein